MALVHMSSLQFRHMLRLGFPSSSCKSIAVCSHSGNSGNGPGSGIVSSFAGCSKEFAEVVLLELRIATHGHHQLRAGDDALQRSVVSGRRGAWTKGPGSDAAKPCGSTCVAAPGHVAARSEAPSPFAATSVKDGEDRGEDRGEDHGLQGPKFTNLPDPMQRKEALDSRMKHP